MSMQLDAKFKKEQIGTLFVRVEALEGGLGGWVVFRGFRFTSKSKHAFKKNTLLHQLCISDACFVSRTLPGNPLL